MRSCTTNAALRLFWLHAAVEPYPSFHSFSILTCTRASNGLEVGEALLDSEVSVMILLISRICWLSLLEMLIRVEFRACNYKCEYTYVYISIRCVF
jgi:hypothetical protein